MSYQEDPLFLYVLDLGWIGVYITTAKNKEEAVDKFLSQGTSLGRKAAMREIKQYDILDTVITKGEEM